MTRRPDSPSPAGSAWVAASERGSRLALRLAVWCFRRLGVRPIRVSLIAVATYYCFFAREGRRASRAYLDRIERVRGSGAPRRPFRDAYRHFHTFADVILDRFSFWAGQRDDFEVVIHERERMQKYFTGETGAFLIGAHLGSFDVLRVIARDAGIRINVLMFSANAQRINEIFEMLDPGCNVRVIHVDPTSVRAAFEIRRCARRGELLAVLGDRVHPGSRSRIGFATFLGERAPFPQGPFLLPILLGLPAVMTAALKTGPRRYEIFLKLLSEGEVVPPRERAKVVQERIETYAAWLEHLCERAPYQWFNFYDFWAESDR